MLKFSKETLTKIWFMQGDLNRMIGRDTIAIGNTNSEMTQEYFDEMRHEVFEAKNCFYHKWWVKEVKNNPELRYAIIDKNKLKVEMIDILHFLISGLHGLANIEVYSNLYESCVGVCYPTIRNDKQCYMSLDWLFREDTLTVMTYYMSICEYLGMTEQDILKIYEMKHAVNIQRQKDGYSVAGKTEKDNEEIESKI
jgi:dimeric dUTPase (all-alpha-NTP-PPase superfamily)